MESYVSVKSQAWLPWFLRGILGLCFLFLLGRLVELQIIKGEYYRDLSDENRIRRIFIAAPRGLIIARGGEIIAGNYEIKKQIVFDAGQGYIKKEVGESFGETVISEWRREYPYRDLLAHLTGYVNLIDKSELGKIDPKCPVLGPKKPTSLIGRSGLEEWYDCHLAGVDGELLIEVDTTGKQIRVLGRKEPQKGNDLKINIDLPLQKKAAEVMKDKTGAVVIQDTGGEVLALYSSPSFDPNWFVPGVNKDVAAVLNDPAQPLFNRAISGLYHPGSVFKPVVAAGALEEGKIDEQYLFNDEGQIVITNQYGTFTYNNWYFTQYGGREGEINLVRAIARSTDTFFYKVGELMGVDSLASWARKFGLDQKTGIELPAERAGLVPDPKWKKETKNENWFLGNTYHMAIGQGDLVVTPAALTRAIAAVSSGKLCRQTLSGTKDCNDLKVQKKSIDLIKKGMTQACSPGGTGFPFFDSPLPVACKTGTAETYEKNVTHAWFVFFTPVDFPEIVATVFVEKGGEGSSSAGPIARQIFNHWFLGKNP